MGMESPVDTCGFLTENHISQLTHPFSTSHSLGLAVTPPLFHVADTRVRPQTVSLRYGCFEGLIEVKADLTWVVCLLGCLWTRYRFQGGAIALQQTGCTVQVNQVGRKEPRHESTGTIGGNGRAPSRQGGTLIRQIRGVKEKGRERERQWE